MHWFTALCRLTRAHLPVCLCDTALTMTRKRDMRPPHASLFSFIDRYTAALTRCASRATCLPLVCLSAYRACCRLPRSVAARITHDILRLLSRAYAFATCGSPRALLPAFTLYRAPFCDCLAQRSFFCLNAVWFALLILPLPVLTYASCAARAWRLSWQRVAIERDPLRVASCAVRAHLSQRGSAISTGSARYRLPRALPCAQHRTYCAWRRFTHRTLRRVARTVRAALRRTRGQRAARARNADIVCGSPRGNILRATRTRNDAV